MSESLQKHVFVPETELVFNENFERDLIQHAHELLEGQRNCIGKGTTAEIHFIELNPKNCLKIISKRSGYSTVIPNGVGELPTYHPLTVEAKFLEDLQGIDSEVRVPRPLYVVTVVNEDEKTWAVEETSLLAMERFPGSSLRDVLENDVELPKNFNPDIFFKKVRVFFEKMHARNVHHRDAHEGNIMVGPEGEPFVIDFGCATIDSIQEAYREERGRKIITYKPDMERIDEVEHKIRKYLTQRAQ